MGRVIPFAPRAVDDQHGGEALMAQASQRDLWQWACPVDVGRLAQSDADRLMLRGLDVALKLREPDELARHLRALYGIHYVLAHSAAGVAHLWLPSIQLQLYCTPFGVVAVRSETWTSGWQPLDRWELTRTLLWIQRNKQVCRAALERQVKALSLRRGVHSLAQMSMFDLLQLLWRHRVEIA